jgi:hypothetical protein
VCRYIDQRVGWSVLRDTAAHFGDTGKAEAAAFLEHVMSSGITTYNETMRELKGADGTPPKPTLQDQVTQLLARMREVMADVPEMLEEASRLANTHGWTPSYRFASPDYKTKAQAIREALGVTEAQP